jgi:DNA-binding transcriptional LysR family regulator
MCSVYELEVKHIKVEYLGEYIILAKYLNFSIAAGHLFISQPALSRHIAIIEQEVGAKLFLRDKHTVRLTEAGKEIATIMDKYNHAVDRIALSNKGFSGKISIGFLNYAMEIYLSPVVTNFSSLFPNIHIEPFPSRSGNEVLDNLLSDKIDAGIFLHVDFANGDHLQIYDFCREPLIVLLNKKHKFANRESIFLSELKNENFINARGIYDEGHQASVYKLCRNHGFEPINTLWVNSFEAAILSIQSEGGIYLEPRSVRTWNFSNVACVDIKDEDCYFDGCIVYKRSNNNPAIPLLLKQYNLMKKTLLL